MATDKDKTASFDLVLEGYGPRHQQIERAIRAKIQSGAWPPGYHIPPEEELARHLGVSRNPLNKVLRNLADAKLITRRPRLGTFVSERTDNHAVIGVIDIQNEIEKSGRRYSFDVLERRVVSAREFEIWTDVDGGEKLLRLSLLHKANDVGEVFEERLIRLAVIPEAETESFQSVLPNQWLLARLPCTKLINTVKATLPGRRIANALGLAQGEPLLVSERRSWADDDVVTWVRLSFPGYRNEFVGEFNPLLPASGVT